jgi:signal transduction histidine kinase
MPVATALIDFGRVVAAARTPGEVMARLVDIAVDSLGTRAAAVLEVSEKGRLRVAAARGLSASLEGWCAESDTIGAELSQELLAAAGPPLAHARQFPLVADGDLYGVLVLLDDHAIELHGDRAALAEAFVDLAAIAAGRAAAHDELARSYAELRSSRDVLARTERLRLLGQMSAGISHDVKNLLNPIGLQLELLRRRIEKGDAGGARETIAQLQGIVRHGVDVVERLRDFSRQEREIESELVDLAATATAAVELSRARVAQHPAIALRASIIDVPPVRARSSELATAVVNLIANATDALAEHGAIDVSTGEADHGAWVEVADDGPGMPPEVERRVFEPFFTTKEDGTGLGLAMVYAFVQRHGGRVTLTTAPRAGTRIRLWFPAAAGAERAIPSTHADSSERDLS